jgi:hypothetical protein
VVYLRLAVLVEPTPLYFSYYPIASNPLFLNRETNPISGSC